MPRNGARDMAKEHHWRSLLKDWQASAINGAEYCRRHEINYTQFKDWQKIIRRRDAESPTSTSRKSGWPKGKPRKDAAKRVERSSSTATSEVAFVAAKIRDPIAVSATIEHAEMEIILRCGIVLRVNSDCQPIFLSTVVAALENR
ncbi:hypothetical protein BH10CYA1_BH10CYA1_62340 [soil metagenome]